MPRGIERRTFIVTLVGALAAAACAEGNDIAGMGGAGATQSSTTSAIASGSGAAQTTSSGTGQPKSCSATPSTPLACGASCVDPMSNVAHCGGCDRACVDPPNGDAACIGGNCIVGTCIDGYVDCNHQVVDGCERQLECGPGTPMPDCEAACAGGCIAVAETCNLADDDCNDVCDDTAASCRVGVHRSSGPTGHFYTTDANEAGCCGLTVESTNYFYLYTSQSAGLVPFYRCLMPSGHHFYTPDAGCGGGTLEGAMGFIATAASCGATPLYYLNLAGGDHFYTTAAAERDYAVTLGYVDQGIVGYIWLAP